MLFQKTVVGIKLDTCVKISINLIEKKSFSTQAY